MAKNVRTVRLKVYKFEGLSEIAQSKVINREIDFMIEYEYDTHYADSPGFKKAMDKAESLKTPWFAASYVYEYCAADILESLSDPDSTREYLENGDPYIK